MSKATSSLPAAPGRRDFLAASVLTALSGLPAAALTLPGAASAETASAAHPDAELIGLCGQIVELERLWGIESDKSSHLTPKHPVYIAAHVEMDRLQGLQEPILDRIYELPTCTLDGFRARARAIMAADYGQMEREHDHRGQLYSLMHDLIREPV